MSYMLILEKFLFEGLLNGSEITTTPLEEAGLFDCQTLATDVCIGQPYL